MKRFVITLMVALLVFAGSFAFFSSYLDRMEASSFREKIHGVELGEGNVIEPVVEKEILFLLAGVDQLEDGVESVRTDTLMLFKVNTGTGKISIISIPRDTQVLVRGEWDKVNHAHAYGGMTLTLKTIRDWLGIDLDYFVKLDFKAVEEIVDAMGGVYVDMPMDIKHESYGIDLKEGRQLLDGNEAIYFARYRKGYENGDIGRVAAQQMLMQEIIKQALSAKNIPKLGSFVSTYMSKVDTNISLGMILELIPMASKMDTDDIDTYTIPGFEGMENETSYYFYNEDETQAIIDEVLPEYKIHEMGEDPSQADYSYGQGEEVLSETQSTYGGQEIPNETYPTYDSEVITEETGYGFESEEYIGDPDNGYETEEVIDQDNY